MDDFANRLLDWFATNGRKDLPWQKNPTPYRVWVSEIMLQQTQVATVTPYYLRFIESFPDIDALADAKQDDVLHHWSGLGYYARARNLHKAARAIRDEHGGEFPHDIDDVVALPGIGKSTAGAILALSRGGRHAILDGNAKRVLARFHAVEGWPGKPAIAKELWAFAEQHTPKENVAAYTQAIMDLGATICTRTSPGCDVCPLSTDCVAHRQGSETDFPGRREKRARPLKTTQMVLVYANDAVFLERRPVAGIWGGLWSFPEIDPHDDAGDWCRQALNASPVAMTRWPTLRHSFSHYDLDIEPVAVKLQNIAKVADDAADRTWYELDSPQQLGIAAPVSNLIEQLRTASL